VGDLAQSEQTKQLMSYLNTCISRIESKIGELHASINELKRRIDSIYDEESLKQFKYNLHSVCIHEGNAASGHFWTYIWNKQKLKWYKYNDVEVSESTWDDLYSNAVGGLATTSPSSAATAQSVQQASGGAGDKTPSAYFLIYTNANESANLYQEELTNELADDLLKLLKADQDILENQVNNAQLKHVWRELNESVRKSNVNIGKLSESKLCYAFGGFCFVLLI
jgi:hypothetical protein